MATERTADTQKTAADSAPFDTASKVAGLVLSGFVGAFTFLGISQGEVGVILRNEPWAPGVEAVVIGLAAGAALASAFVNNRWINIFLAVGLWVACLTAIPVVFSVLPVRTPSFDTGWLGLLIPLGAIAGILLVVGICTFGIGSFRNFTWSLQPVLLVIGLLLLVAAIGGGLRLEGRSQSKTTSPRIDESVERTDKVTTLTLKVQASRLRADDAVQLSVYEGTRDQLCATEPVCIAQTSVKPDVNGAVNQTIKFPLEQKAFSSLIVDARPCARKDVLANPPTCKPDHATSMSLIIPTPPAATPSTEATPPG